MSEYIVVFRFVVKPVSSDWVVLSVLKLYRKKFYICMRNDT